MDSSQQDFCSSNAEFEMDKVFIQEQDRGFEFQKFTLTSLGEITLIAHCKFTDIGFSHFKGNPGFWYPLERTCIQNLIVIF
jgi:hypothetical protein